MGAPNPYVLHPQVQAKLDQLLTELPPLTDAQLDALCDVLVMVRLRADDEGVVKPYTREAAEADLEEALDRGDLDQAMDLASALDRWDVPQPPSLRGSALWYAARGLPVFPLSPGTKLPMRGSQGVTDATTDTDQVDAWWGRWPDANIGLATGHGVDALDFDGLAAHAAWEADWREHLGMPPLHSGPLADQPELTWEMCGVTALATVTTPRPGGLHVYVPSSGLGNGANLVPHVDYRGLGGYVVAPPSTTELGAYRFLRRLELAP